MQVAAVHKAEDVGVAGLHSDLGALRGVGGGADGEPVHAVDDQLLAVVDLGPVAVAGADAAVVLGLGQSKVRPVQNDGAVRADGGQQLVGGGHGDGAAGGYRRGLGLLGQTLGETNVVRTQLLIAHGGEGRVVQHVAAAVHGQGPGARVPGADLRLVREKAAVHHRTVAIGLNGVVQLVALQQVREEEAVPRPVAQQENGGIVIVDAAVCRRKAVGLVGGEEGVGRPVLDAAHPVDLAAVYPHVPAVGDLHGAGAALVDVGAGDGKLVAVDGPDAHGAAAVEAAAVHRDAAAAFKVQHAPGADAGFPGVARGQVPDLQIRAAGEADHVHIAGDGGDGGVLPSGTPDAQALHVQDLQLVALAVIAGVQIPAVIGVFCGETVVGGGGEVVLAGGKLDGGVGADGGQELVHGADPD